MRDLDYDQVINDIQQWIKRYVTDTNIEGIVVGISGGIDSAVTSTLCVKAIGKQKVIGLGLPCLSIPQDLKDAKIVADFLDIEFIVLDLSSIYEEFLKISSDKLQTNKLASANLKARLRMIAWYFVGQSKGRYLIGGTGNRTELAIGYFTKYGDGGVDFEPIGGLYKSEVREVARRLGIPEQIIKKVPSAGLWKGQTDEGEIGMTYDLLDEIIYRIDYDLDLEGLASEDLEKVKAMMRASEHKLKKIPTFEIKKEHFS